MITINRTAIVARPTQAFILITAAGHFEEYNPQRQLTAEARARRRGDSCSLMWLGGGQIQVRVPREPVHKCRGHGQALSLLLFLSSADRDGERAEVAGRLQGDIIGSVDPT